VVLDHHSRRAPVAAPPPLAADLLAVWASLSEPAAAD